MQIIQDLSLNELETLVLNLGEQKYRARQIYDGINLGKSISEINIPKTLREKLLESFEDVALSVYKTVKGKDGTQKFIYKLSDGNIIEGVLLSYNYGYSLCVSTQVGCRMGCKFCASTLGGLIRNLTAGEILSQVIVVNRLLGGELGKKRKITHVVLMGSGEPLDNYDNVLKFLRLVNAEEGLNISMRNISVSTCGLVPMMRKLAGERLQVVLTVSLHAPNDKIRKTLMPIANKYSVKDVVGAARYYFEQTGRRVIFEYALSSGVNDSDACAGELAALLKGFPNHINVIPLNKVDERDVPLASTKLAERFAKKLSDLGLSATVRRTLGEDIGGACGQLRNSVLEEEK